MHEPHWAARVMGAAVPLIFVVLISVVSSQAVLRTRRDTTPRPLNPKWNATNADELKRELMLNYDKFTRPAEGNATKVFFDPSINHVELDEALSILTVHCWVQMHWQDPKLTWNPDDYGGLKILHLADHEIWQPDIVPYNSASGSSVDLYSNTHVLLYNDGGVIWVPPAILKVFCALDLRKWPFDTQKCNIKVGSWTYSGHEIDLNFTKTKSQFENFIPNAAWKVVDSEASRNSKFYPCCVEPYIDLNFNLTLRRVSPTYKTLIITPITAIIFMTLATFWLPATSLEKITLGGTTTIVISLFLLYFTQKISTMAGYTPYIVSFYASSLYLVAFSVVSSVVVINLASTPKSSSIPWIIKAQLNGGLGRILLLGNSSERRTGDDENSDSSPVMADESPKNSQREWRMLAVAIDRVLFLIYCLLFICFALAFLT